MAGVSYCKREPLREFPFRDADDVFLYLREGRVMVPRAATVDAKHIERAYVRGNREEQIRIEVYGRLEREKFADLMAPFRPLLKALWETRAGLVDSNSARQDCKP